MGKGDKKSRRGKIHIGAWGARRARKHRSTAAVAKPEPKPKKINEETEKPPVNPEIIPVTGEPEVKKPATRKPARKTAEKPEGEETKPKTVRTKKKAAEEGEAPQAELPTPE